MIKGRCPAAHAGHVRRWRFARWVAPLALYGALLPSSAQAVCLGSGDAEVDALVQAIGRRPVDALRDIDLALAGGNTADPARQAWLAAARAAALDMQGQADEQLAAAVQQASQTLPARHLARLHLETMQLFRAAPQQDIGSAVADIRGRLPAADDAGSLCLKARLAYVLAGRDELLGDAFQLAADAYERSGQRALPWMRAEAASMLAQIVRFMADKEFALELNSEALAYFEREQMHDMVANELAMRGWATVDSRDPASLTAAALDFRRSAQAAQAAGNAVALGYAESGLCEVLNLLSQPAEALPICKAGYQRLRGSGDHAEYGLTVSYASALVGGGRPQDALNLLRPLLKQWPGWDTGYYGFRAHQVMGQAQAAVGDLPASVASLESAIRVMRDVEASNRLRSATVTQARFRTQALQQTLARQVQEAQDSRQRNRLLFGVAALVVLMLSAIIVILVRHRRLYRRLAFTDPLTAAANRRYSEARMGEMLQHASARAEPMSIAILDLDHFKSCNDRYGHDAGDEALRRFASTARRVLRPGDLLGRWGGEEFLLGLPQSDRQAAAAVIERLRSAAAAERLELAPDYPLRFSAGVVMAGADAPAFAELLAQADQALYHAKAAGRNQTCFADD